MIRRALLPGLIAALVAILLGGAAVECRARQIARDLTTGELSFPQRSETRGSSWYYRVSRGDNVIRIDAKGVSARITEARSNAGPDAVPLPRWSRFNAPPTPDQTNVERTELAIGWPWPSHRALVEWSAGRGLPPLVIEGTARSRSPWVRPSAFIWSGLILDTLVCAAPAWIVLTLLWLVLFEGRVSARRLIRRRRGRCPMCAYDLRGDLTAGCPECGWKRPMAAVTSSDARRTPTAEPGG